MPTAQHVVSLMKSFIEGNDETFLSIATQVAAREARQGHGRVAQQLKDLIDQARSERSTFVRREGVGGGVVVREDLTGLLSVSHPDTRLANMVLVRSVAEKLHRVLHEQKQQSRLSSFGLTPRRKLLLVGPPGSGKTMTAAAIAGELDLPLLAIRLDGVITKFMGESAGKLRRIFESMVDTRGVYLFDEFDAIGANRGATNDVGEVRRILNSFLQFLEVDESKSLIIAATNHPDLLDRALFRRFDDVIAYQLPDVELAQRIVRARLAQFDTTLVAWAEIGHAGKGLSQADFARAADEAAKSSVLEGHTRITTLSLLSAISERKASDVLKYG